MAKQNTMNSNKISPEKVKLFWEEAGNTFGFDVARPYHPMHEAFITFIEMRYDEESDEDESDEDEPKIVEKDECDDCEEDDVIEWFDAQCFDKEESWNYVLDVAEERFKCEFIDGARKKISNWLFSRFKELQEEESEEEEESDEPKIVEKDECDDCEGKCRADETETCEKCAVELRIGCGNNPSDESIFNGFCDDCREEGDLPLCKDCEIETRKHCDECGGYGSDEPFSDEDEESDEDEPKIVDVQENLTKLISSYVKPKSYAEMSEDELEKMESDKINSNIVFEISRDDLTEMIKYRNEDLSDKQINKIITSIKNTDYVSWLENEVRYYCDECRDEGSDEEE